MHCQLLLRVMRCHGLGSLLDSPANGMHIRKLLWQTVLATDMSMHDQFMRNFKDIIDGQLGSLCIRQVIVCQAIMKCADISNPVCPESMKCRASTHLFFFFPEPSISCIAALGNCLDEGVDIAGGFGETP